MRLVNEIDRELAETVALRGRGGNSGIQLVNAQRQRTDEMVRQYRQAATNAQKAVPQLAEVLNQAAQDLESLTTIRVSAISTQGGTSNSSDQSYNNLAASLIAVADELPNRVLDPDLANQARAVAALASVQHIDSQERALIRAILARNSLGTGELASLATLVGQRNERVAAFNRVTNAQERRMYAQVVTGSDIESSKAMLQGVLVADRNDTGLHADPDLWYTAQSGLIRRINIASLKLSNQLGTSSDKAANDAIKNGWSAALGTIGIALISLVTAWVLAVRTSRRLRKLRAAALTVSRRELPEAIHAVTTGEMPPTGDPKLSAAAVTRSLAASNDEIGQVADAFASVHRTALQLAGEQAELRVDVTRMAEILARRIRTLITRQLRLLDEFEKEETDPDALARLFALDHLAARLRRNGENLLVLAGGEPGSAYTQAFPLAAVVTAAASEIEDFTRVEAAVGDVMVASGAVADVVRVLAELLENAANFSPPETAVRVDARRTVDGTIVRVHDSGIGIAAAKLNEINARLAQPATLTSAAAGTMGLHVVAHLSARHGIRVQLHPTGNGTVAYVALPNSILTTRLASGKSDGPLSGQPALPAQQVTAVPAGAPAPAGAAALVGWHAAPEERPRVDRFGARIEAASQPPATWFEQSALEAAQAAAYPAAPVSAVPVSATPVSPVPVSPPSGPTLVWATPANQPGPQVGTRTGAQPIVGSGPLDAGSWSSDQPTQVIPVITDAAPPREAVPVAGTRPAPTVGEPLPLRIPGQRNPVPTEGNVAWIPARPEETDQSVSAANQQSGRAPEPEDSGAGGNPLLPRRNPGALLAPEVAATAQAPAPAAGTVDPEAVRARLSAFAEGVSAAYRRNSASS